MKVVTFNKRVIINRPNDKHVIICNPGTRYLIDDAVFLDLCQSPEIGDRIERFSDGPPFVGASGEISGSKFLFSRLRGIGDELATTAVVKWFFDQGAECSVLSTSERELIWRNNPSVHSMLSEPLALDTVWRSVGNAHYDKMFHMESLIESNQEPDQENLYDMMFRFCGQDPASIDPEYKRPYIYLTEEEISSIRAPETFIFLQIHASNLTRSIPDHKTIEILEALSNQDYPVLAVGDEEKMSDEVKAAIISIPGIHFKTASHVREYMSYIYRSSLVIGPDSSGIHVAAAFNKPAIGFWGPFSPECRAKYYRNHHAIWNHSLCRRCPCFPPSKDLPTHLCPKGENQTSCEVFEGISGQGLIEKVKMILN